MPQTLLMSTTDRNCRPTWHKFHLQGGKEYTYTVNIHNTHILQAPFEFCGRNFGQRPPTGKAPYHSLIYIIYIYLLIMNTLNSKQDMLDSEKDMLDGKQDTLDGVQDKLDGEEVR
jgi:hypothetical protein